MKFKVTVAAVAVVALFAVSFVGAEEKAEKKDPLAKAKCPLSGKAVQADKIAEYKGAKVYFCCGNCPKAFAKNPKKHAAKANHQLVMTKQAKQEKCPISKGKLNEDAKTKVAAVQVHFCCEKCQGKVAAMEEKEQITFVFNDETFEKAFTVKKQDNDKKST